MFWKEAGSGRDAVLFVHGFPLTGALWEDELAEAASGWRYLAPDLPGFGGSPALPEMPLTMDLLADLLATFLDEQRLERAVVCGLSMGGYIAFALWRRHPQRVRALVLTSTRAGPDTPDTRRGRYERAARVRAEGTHAVTEPMVPQLLSEATRRERPEIVARLRGIMNRVTVEGLAGVLEGVAERPDSTPTLATINVPTLVLAGEDDTISPPEEMRALADAIPGAVFRMLPGAGHLTPLEAPDAFNAELRAFLRERVAGG
jgi:pimeloyl-ACP methyl ester carboxylesterase